MICVCNNFSPYFTLQVDHDVLDVNNELFENCCSNLKLTVQDLECRLASIIAQVLSVSDIYATVQIGHFLFGQVLSTIPPSAHGCEFMQGFDDCVTLSSAFKIFESFEGLVDRDSIKTNLEHLYYNFLGTFANELTEASHWE